MANEKNNFSAILISLTAILFFAYQVWLMFSMQAWLKGFGMISIVILFGVNVWKQVTRKTNTSQMIQWIFILIAVIFWMAHTLIFGKLSHIV